MQLSLGLCPPKAGAKLLSLSPRRPRTSLPSLRVSAFKDDDKDLQKPYKVNTKDSSLVPAFTRRREHAVGRVAMLGVAAAWAGEVLTGMGPMSQLAYELGVSTGVAYGITAMLATWQLLLAVNQFSPTWDAQNQRDVNRRTKDLTSISPTEEPGKFLLRNELILGRVAMLIFAGAVILEFFYNGESPLAHSGLIVAGVPLRMAPWWLKLGIGVFSLGGLGALSGFGTRKDADTY